MTIDIRAARSADTSVVRDLVRASYSKYVERIDYASLIAAGDVWVAVEDGEVLGVLVMRAVEEHLFVDNVAVRPDQQGRGLGRALMAFAEEEAIRNGLWEIRLYTNEKMFENLAVYEKLGFEEIERRLDSGYQRVFMRKMVS
jgi:ribosomal protein S18 acetylase RimI-like enzyme